MSVPVDDTQWMNEVNNRLEDSDALVALTDEPLKTTDAHQENKTFVKEIEIWSKMIEDGDRVRGSILPLASQKCVGRKRELIQGYSTVFASEDHWKEQMIELIWNKLVVPR